LLQYQLDDAVQQQYEVDIEPPDSSIRRDVISFDANRSILR